MKVSARNTLKGKVAGIEKGAVNSLVKIDVGGHMISASVTNDAVAELDLKVGDEAFAIVKASDVMVGKDH